MTRLPHDIDIHTHSGNVRHDAILCVDPVEKTALPEGEGLLSVGIHPWNAAGAGEDAWLRLEKWLDDPRVIAVGEVGLDKLRGPGADVQEPVFIRQAEIAARRGLPVIIHCVRYADRILNLRKKFDNQWIWHGFRGKPEQARQLLDAGIDLSYGLKYNEESFARTPDERRYRETD